MTTDADVIPFHVTFGTPGDDTFDLRFPAEFKDEIVSLLDANGIEHGSDPDIAADTHLAMEAVKVLRSSDGLEALSSIIETFVKRHSERVALKLGDTEIPAAGVSANYTEQVLQTMEMEQATMDAEWLKQLGKLPSREV